MNFKRWQNNCQFISVHLGWRKDSLYLVNEKSGKSTPPSALFYLTFLILFFAVHICNTKKKFLADFFQWRRYEWNTVKKNLLLVAIVKGFRVKDLPTQCKKVSKTFGDFLASPYKISRGDFLHPHFVLLSVNKFPGWTSHWETSHFAEF